MRLKWTKEKQLWHGDIWMKVIFSDESKTCIGQSGDDGSIGLVLFK